MTIPAALALAAKTARQLCGITVTIRRPGKQPIVGLAVTKGKSTFEAEDSDGLVTRFETIDWLVDPAAYDFGDGPVPPERGDTIEETAGNKKYIFALFAPQPEPVWRWSDGYRTQLRLHSQLIDTQ